MKESIVFIPGMMCDKRLFAPQIQNLSSKYKCLVADLTKNSSIEQYATDILEKAPERFILLGVSLGGIVAMEIAKRANTRISHLILMDTNPFVEKEVIRNQRHLLINDVENGSLASVMKEYYIPKYFYVKKLQKGLQKTCFDMAITLGAKTFIKQSKALMERNSQIDGLKDLDCKTLIVCGEYDQLCPISYHVTMNKLIKNSKLVILNKTGHLPTLENPKITNQQLQLFLAN